MVAKKKTKDIKTTIGGVAGGVALIATGIALFVKGGDTAGAVTAVVSGVTAIWLGFHAKDAAQGK